MLRGRIMIAFEHESFWPETLTRWQSKGWWGAFRGPRTARIRFWGVELAVAGALSEHG